MRPTQGLDLILYPLVGKEASGGSEDGSVTTHVGKISMATKRKGTGLESFRAFPCRLHSLLQYMANPWPTSVGGLSPACRWGHGGPAEYITTQSQQGAGTHTGSPTQCLCSDHYPAKALERKSDGGGGNRAKAPRQE